MGDKKAAFVVKGDLLGLWQKARAEFLLSSIAEEHKVSVEAEYEPKPEEWLKKFQHVRHGDSDKFSSACHMVGSNLKIIQRFVRAFGFAVDVVSIPFPAASPASLVVNAFASLFASFSKVSEDFDKIEDFFRRVADRLLSLETLSKHLGQPGKRDNLQERIVKLFICCLSVGKIGSEKVKHRPVAWCQQWSNETKNKLDPELERFDEALKSLRLSIQTETYVAAIETNEAVEKLAQGVHNERDEILDWMSTFRHYTMHHKIEQQLPADFNGGRWLRESELFKSWKEGATNRVWYIGKPGAGKSVIAYSIINDLKSLAESSSSHDILVAYLYLTYTSQADVKILLGSILRQLQAGSNLNEQVLKKFRDCRQCGRSGSQVQPPSMNDIRQMLSAVAKHKTVFVVVDALDESEQEIRQDLLEYIKDIGPNVKLLVTSRHLHHLETLQQGFQTSEIQAHNDDIEEYIESVIRKHTFLSMRQGLHQEIKREVQHRSGNMFIIVQLHMGAIAEVGKVADLKKLLRSLPEDLDGAYRKTMERIKHRDDKAQSRALFCLGWVAFSQRLLSTDELLHALAIYELRHDSTPDAYSNDILQDHMHLESEVISDCCGLLTDLVGEIRFVHRSAQEFFSRIRDTEFRDLDKQVTLACVDYLTTVPLQSKTAAPGERLSMLELSKEFPLLRYTGQHLHRHHRRIKNLERDEEVLEAIHSFVSDGNATNLYSELLSHFNAYDTKSALLIKHNRRAIRRTHSTKPLPPLHIVAYLGNPGVLTRLLRDGAAVSELDPYGQSPLDIAIKYRLDTVASILLRSGAEVDLATRTGHAILLHAMEGDQRKFVQQVIGHPSRPLLGDSFLTILGILYMIMLTPLEVMRPFLLSILEVFRALPLGLPATNALEPSSTNSRIEQITASDPSLEKYRVLLSCAYEGDDATLELLLDPSASDPINMTLESSENDPRGSFVEDCYDSDSEIDSDSDIDSELKNDSEDSDQGGIDSGNSSLNERRWMKGTTAISLAPEEMKAAFLRTACFLAVESGKQEAVVAFLKVGIPPNLRNYQGQCLLHRATARSNGNLVKLLLEFGAEVDLRDHNGRSALLANAGIAKHQVLKILIQHKADLNLLTTGGCHELYEAAVFGAPKAVDFFLREGVNASIRNRFGWAPLHGAAANGHMECVRLLLEDGRAEASPISDTGKTPKGFVEDGEEHYDSILTGREQYAAQVMQAQELSFEERAFRRDEILHLLSKYGGRTPKELIQEMGIANFKNKVKEWGRARGDGAGDTDDVVIILVGGEGITAPTVRALRTSHEREGASGQPPARYAAHGRWRKKRMRGKRPEGGGVELRGYRRR
ncbi:hypothetical protein PG999_007449 [Apiospora kogelbergensis]|uniref:NACHT domain-containing protein n=1 Tax=Apiospora kogelbergensis TaxID=1337665 RepID=A0AAW0QYE9_9PEZI